MMSLKTANILAILLACTAIAQSNDCNKACTFEYNPVCGFNSVTGDYQVFGNPCAFELVQCEDSVWTKANSLALCQADATDIAAEEIKCEKPCTREFNPICGFNGDVHQIFSNLCELENAHCADGKAWFQTMITDCYIPVQANCKKPCTREFNPICGFNGDVHKVFSNLCVLENAHCDDGKAWFKTIMTDCYIPVQARCEKPCTREYVPVCGFNGETHKVFANKCELENAHCQDDKTWSEGVMAHCLARVAAPQKLAVDNQANTKECPKICPMIYQPTCGFDGQNYKFFSNKCEMEVNNCNDHSNFQIVGLDLCETEQFQKIVPYTAEEKECPKICPMIYQPTCGFDGQNYKFFSNKCEMEVNNCNDHSNFQIVGLDLCETEQFQKIVPYTAEEKECPKICPMIYQPTCGFDGQNYKFFSNKCEMEVNNCNDHSNFQVVNLDKCNEVSFISLETEEKDCRKVCPKIYFPMCGFYNGIYKMFSNLCTMEVQNCNENTDFQVVSMYKCEDDFQFVSLQAQKKNCQKRCTKIYQPTCGFDGKLYQIFSNPCVMEVINCNEETNYQIVNLEKCNSQQEFISYEVEEKNCPKICTLDYTPTCGYDGQNYKIFSNKCEMEVNNCNEHLNFQVVNLDKCNEVTL